MDSDSPVFVVRNAKGYDGASALYMFHVAVASTDREVASVTVKGGTGQTAARFSTGLTRGALLSWRVTASAAGRSDVASGAATFRLPAVQCSATATRFAKRVTDWWLSACTLGENIYNNPNDVLGPPDAAEIGPVQYRGFFSLGEGGYVAVDMEGCAADGPGDDVRVYQSVSDEPVTLYASNSPNGPWLLVEARKTCGTHIRGVFSGSCTFDLARAGLEAARYFKVEDGELYPCPSFSQSNGADIDAVEILNQR